jgi:hypothetical protein
MLNRLIAVAAGGMKDMQAMAVPQQQMQQPQDIHKVFISEKESLELVVHTWELADIEQRIIDKLLDEKVRAQKSVSKKVQ